MVGVGKVVVVSGGTQGWLVEEKVVSWREKEVREEKK